MSRRKMLTKMKLPVLALLVILFGCSSPLMEQIEEEVAQVTTPPSIESLFPESGATAVAVNIDNIVITFTKNIAGSSVSTSTIRISDSNNSTLTGSYAVSGNTVSFNPSNNLAYNTLYTVSIEKGLLDVDGNNITDAFSWSFRTASAPASIKPVVVNFRLDNGSTATNDTTITLNISAADADGGTDGLKAHYKGPDSTDWSDWLNLTDGSLDIAGIDLDSPADGNTYDYEVEVKDGNGIYSDTALVTVKYDITPPEEEEKQPASGETDVPFDASFIKISFNDEMDLSSFTDSTFYISDGVDTITGAIGLSNEGKAVGISEIALTQKTDYTVTVKSTVTDLAGNPLGEDIQWFFRTGDATDTTAPTVKVFELTGGGSATGVQAITLDIEAEDDYNTVRRMKIWGDGTDPVDSNASKPDEEDADWENYSTTRTWTLPATAGEYNIYYKFKDSMENPSPTPGRFKVFLDNVDPGITSVQINSGNLYTNNTDLKVNLSIVAADAHSGLKEMWISNSSDFSTGSWEVWSPIKTGWVLNSGDGVKNVYVKVRDYVNRESGSVSDAITVDLTPPSIDFDPAADFHITNTAATQSGTYTDSGSGTAQFFWEQVDGPSGGSIDFDGEEEEEEPLVSADVEGEYQLQVTVTDAAGNSSYGTVPFVWDVTAPARPAQITFGSNFPYSTTVQPQVSWTASSGAYYYKCSYSADPDWDTPSNDYTIVYDPYFTPSEALAQGSNTVKIVAVDQAGNRSSVGSTSTFVDTIAPFVSNDGRIFLKNGTFTLTYSNDAGSPGPDGYVTETGSGVDSYLWEGLDFGSSYALSTTVTAPSDGTHTFWLTVEDKAGNQGDAEFTLIWDTTGPTPPTLSAPASTPDSTPTWAWESTGDGIGSYRYAFINRYGSSTGWITTTANSFTAPEQSSGQYSLTLNVQDRDEVGNWSASSSHTISVDTTNIVSPFITAQSLTNDSTPTWSWSSGAGADPTAEYQWKLDGGSWSASTSQTTYTPGSALSHGTHTLEVQERYNSVWRNSSKSIDVDLVAPNPPAIIMTKTGTSTTRTYDTTPNFTWSTGGNGGAGIYMFRYQKNSEGYSSWSAETTSTSYTYKSILADTDTLTFQAMERDQAGNWSSAGTLIITIDTTAPTDGSISVEGGNTYTADTSVDLTLSAVDASEMQFCNYSSTLGWGTWSSFESYSTSKTFTITTGDETKYAMVKYKDVAGNVSGFIYDTIILDTTPPSVTSFSINSNGTSTSSSTVTLNSDVSGATLMRMHNGTAGWSTWESYSAAKSWSLSSGYGTKKVTMQYQDAAGNVTSDTAVYDGIFYGQPTISRTTKGDTANGSISAYWYTMAASELGTDYYYIYTATSPTGGKTYRTNTTGTSTTMSLVEGQIYYVFLRIYNTSLGYSDAYSSYMGAYSSDIVIIYNDDDTVDTEIAQQMRTALLYNYDGLSGVSGTRPDWSVVLYPEDDISANYYTTTELDTRLWGDPVIITPGCVNLTNTNRVRNLAFSGGHGIIAMGGYSAYDAAVDFFTKVDTYAATWGVYSPAALIPGGSYSETSLGEYVWTSGNSVWSSPLSSTSFPGGTTPTHNAYSQLSYQDLKRAALYLPGGNPTNGYIYGRTYFNPDIPYMYNVVRVDRYLLFGFDKFPNRTYTGYVYFVNLVARMDDY